ncbi:MAG: signal recognition particle protein, partial [Acutalibacteraceae bacterium]
GMGSKIREEDIDERRFDRIEAIIKSMTPKERAKPDIINPSRKRRIAAGSGTKVEDVNMLLRQYEQIKKMFRQIGGKKGRKNLSRMKLPPGFNF